MEQHKMLHEQIISVLLIVAGFAHWTENEAGTVTLMARAVYFVGMFACTVLFNVPLNSLLARLDPNSARAHQVWSRYLKTWKNWNHLRTVSSLVTCILCIWLLSNY